jgi:hypothetical protein
MSKVYCEYDYEDTESTPSLSEHDIRDILAQLKDGNRFILNMEDTGETECYYLIGPHKKRRIRKNNQEEEMEYLLSNSSRRSFIKELLENGLARHPKHER